MCIEETGSIKRFLRGPIKSRQHTDSPRLEATGILSAHSNTKYFGKNMIYSLILFALLSYASCSDVLEFTDADFASKVADHDLMLVEFFAPW